MIPKENKISTPPLPVARMVEEIVGCKWSLAVLDALRAGVRRPGEMERRLPGLSKKVLNERLRKLMRFDLVSRRVYAEVPPRVEYRLTRFGARFVTLLDAIERLQRRVDAERGRQGP
jgi:DNA-binding HxlR family transcriptional regulator